ncbi:MAG: hypothetical protein O3A91_09160, partial [Proteobacteria bacterium]|nr:hypothetical protein [Pseudomonadota bacterium]
WFDDWIGNGRRNPAKKWWFDHELVDGVAVEPKGTNQRDLDLDRKMDASAQKMAFYHASMMPPPDEQGPVPVDRKAAMAAGALLETPEGARRRAAEGGEPPVHYRPTPARGAVGAESSVIPGSSPYQQLK